MNPRSPAFILLFVVSMVAASGNMALQSVLPAIGREFGIGDTAVSAAFALSAVFWTIASPVWAKRSDLFGRKRIMLVGIGGFVVSMFGFGLAATAGLEKWLGPVLAFLLMVVARSIYGLFGCAAPVATQAYVADRTAPENRTQALSWMASGQGLGTVIGPALAPFFILPVLGLAGPLYAFSLIGLVVFVLLWRNLPSGGVTRTPTEAEKAAAKGLWRDPRLRGFLIYGVLVTGVQATNISVLGFHIIDEMARTGLTAREAQPFIGVAMLAGAAATLMAQWGLIPLLKMKPNELMVWGAGLALAGNALSLVAPGYNGVVVSYALVSMGVGFARPGFTAGASLAVTAREQGAVAGLMASIAGISFLVPPVLGVALYELATPAPFAANVLFLAAALILCFRRPEMRLPPRKRRKATAQAPASQPGPEGAV